MRARQYSEGRGLRRLPLRHPARHRLHGGERFDARRRLLPRPELPGHRPRRRTRRRSPSMLAQRPRNPRFSARPVRAVHRIVDAMVDPTGPRSRSSRTGSTSSRSRSSTGPTPSSVRRILDEKREVACAGSSRRSATSSRGWRGAIRRHQHRDVVPLPRRLRSPGPVADDALIFQDRITGMLDAHLSNVSNRLNEVMKVLTVVATIFMPLTLLAGLYGMNVAAAVSRRRRRAVLVAGLASCRSRRRHAACSAGGAGFERGQDHPPRRRPRQPDRRRRGRRAAGLGRQGAGRERDRRRARAGSRIHVELGGKKQVRVEDDGEGMEPEDARLAIERHATSKIRRADDLAAIRDARVSRRGAAVDRVGVAFRAAHAGARAATAAPRFASTAGRSRRSSRSARPRARVIEVNDLFYNLPARRKFLKSDGAEIGAGVADRHAAGAGVSGGRASR